MLLSWAKYCEVRVARVPGPGHGTAKDEKFCCSLIKDMLEKSIKDVIDRIRQSSLFQQSQGYDFAFKCPQSNCKKRIGYESLVVVLNPKDLKSLNCESCKFMQPLK